MLYGGSMPWKLLLVEDEPAIRGAMQLYFSARSHLVDAAESLSEAEALLGAGSYDVVLLDLLIGPRRESSLRLLPLLAAKAQRPWVVVVSGGSLRELEPLQTEIHATVSKPCSLPELEDVVRNLMSRGGAPCREARK